MYKALFLSPMVPSRDTAKTAEFLHRALDFDVQILDSEYAICTKDGLTLHLQPMGEGVGPMSVYLEVEDVDRLWDGLDPHLEGIRHKAPFDREYGMREIHLDIPHTNTLLFIGQCI